MVIARQNEPLAPPRLTMEKYVEFVGASMMLVDPEKARLQKKFEENIHVMFSFQDSIFPHFSDAPTNALSH
jgi:hypothetical protein